MSNDDNTAGTVISPVMIAASKNAGSYGSLDGITVNMGRAYITQAFIDGADWMALQIKERPVDYGLMTVEHHEFVAADMVERATDYSVAARLADQVAKLMNENRALIVHRDGLIDGVDARDQQIAARDEAISAKDGLISDLGGVIDKRTAERDDWHAAYDKLVSDVVHGRPHTERLVPRGPFPDAQLQAHQDAATFGLGVVEVKDGVERCIDPRDLYTIEPEQAEAASAKWDSAEAARIWRGIAQSRGHYIKELEHLIAELAGD